MKVRLVGLAALAAVCCAAGDVAGSAAATCMSDPAFRGDMGRWVYAAGFQATVANARSLEKQHLYDLVRQQFASQAAEPPQPLSRPCTLSPAFTDARRRAAIVRVALGRVTMLIAAFPLKRAASQNEWRPVLLAATSGGVAALRLARDIGTSSMKVAQLNAQVAALRLETARTT